MAARKAKAAAPKMSKVKFIRKHGTKKPRDVEALAKEQGLKITAQYVSSIRSKDKTTGTSGRGAGQRGRKSLTQSGEAEFRRALQGITLARAREILDEITAAYGA